MISISQFFFILVEHVCHSTRGHDSWSVNLTFFKTLANLETMELVTGTKLNQNRFISKL